ncbi:MAG: rhomboid family intramembrane serine protease [Bacteroidia bacterium]
MLPLYDTIPSRQRPWVNYLLIGLNVFIFLYQLGLSEIEMEHLFFEWGLVPLRFSDPAWALDHELSADGYHVFLTNTFLHSGWAHLISNMWTLWIFGDNVEDRMGKMGYLLFYLLCGVLASVTHFFLYSFSAIPAIGASGAISGVMGAYALLFPHSRIIFLVPLLFWPFFIGLPAYLYIGGWFIGQLFSGTLSLAVEASAAGIAFWAHIGGFVAGVVLYRFFLRRNEFPRVV